MPPDASTRRRARRCDSRPGNTPAAEGYGFPFSTPRSFVLHLIPFATPSPRAHYFFAFLFTFFFKGEHCTIVAEMLRGSDGKKNHPPEFQREGGWRKELHDVGLSSFSSLTVSLIPGDVGRRAPRRLRRKNQPSADPFFDRSRITFYFTLDQRSQPDMPS